MSIFADSNVDFSKLKFSIQPQVLAGILSLDERDLSNFTDLVRIVQADPQMTTFVLKAANSSLYSRGKEIRTLNHAVGLLGYRVMRSLAVMHGSQSIFGLGDYSRFKRLVWRHSVMTAIIARKLSDSLGVKEMREEAFIAGLLHDIGKVALNVIDRRKFIEVINTTEKEANSFADVEFGIFGFNHLQIGAHLLEDWKLPDIYRPVLRHHRDLNSPEVASLKGPDRGLLFLVSYANFLAKKYGYGHYSEDDEMDAKTLRQALALDRKDVEYYEVRLPKQLPEDEFYEFFSRMM